MAAAVLLSFLMPHSRKREKPARVPSRQNKEVAAPVVLPPPELVIITGMSGSGKASVLKAFEDLGYYCVDNLPVELIPRFAELAVQSAEIQRTALVVDVREGSKLEQLPAFLKSVRRMIPTKVLFWKPPTQSCCGASARRGGRIRWARMPR